MNVLVIGAHGSVGNLVVDKLQENSQHTPIAMVRKKEQQESFQNQGVKTVLADLEDPIDTLVQAASGADAIVFAAGSGGSTGADKTMFVDLDGAVKSVEAAKKANIDRFVIVSAMGSQQWLEPHPEWLEKLGPYYPAKFYADQWLKNSGLNYTIVRPGLLSDDEAKDKIQVADTPDAFGDQTDITRSDVAQIVVESLANEHTKKKEFDVVNGDTKISEALDQL
ncbi:NAD(P)-dependent oxidoreductase [Tetragenococcus osmophilus]|uniref:NAD(P)-dependent oxidoreductase n=1 Tax=Tetragenococcus osmophilus TaxID=526944 RepID=A0AA37XJC5_9ENTE|nr:SDR family oxidoreductase [Tetragenococcus osmophilus]AYW48643.1 NAD(P)-dependent oxidoreductase [Tetragenococcus osmophilus]GMA54574.1 putative sugar epimerase YhfK [Alicyclobacillus contaminans]GMA71583.1 putative sugar epimerase YhfK [Tetragenococcus osmophilus]